MTTYGRRLLRGSHWWVALVAIGMFAFLLRLCVDREGAHRSGDDAPVALLSTGFVSPEEGPSEVITGSDRSPDSITRTESVAAAQYLVGFFSLSEDDPVVPTWAIRVDDAGVHEVQVESSATLAIPRWEGSTILLVGFDDALSLLIAFDQSCVAESYRVAALTTGLLDISVDGFVEGDTGSAAKVVLQPMPGVIEDLPGSTLRQYYFEGSGPSRLHTLPGTLDGCSRWLAGEERRLALLKDLSALMARRIEPSDPLVYPIGKFSPVVEISESRLLVEGLPAGGVYSWMIDGSYIVDSALAQEQFELDLSRRDDNDAPLNSHTPFGGSFRITRGVAARIGLVRSDLGSVFGQLADYSPHELSRVSLVFLQRPGTSPVEYLSGEVLSTVRASSEGKFLFYGLGPGEFRISAYWQLAGAHYCLTRQFDLAAGENLDLGLLAPDLSAPLSLRLGFQEGDSILPPTEVLMDDLSDGVRVRLTGLQFEDPLSTFDDFVFLDPHTDALIYGLPSGRWRAELSSSEFKGRWRDGFKFAGSRRPGVTIEHPLQSEMHIIVPVERTLTKYRVQVQFPEETRQRAFNWQVWTADSRKQAAGTIEQARESSEAYQYIEFSGGAGPYSLYICEPRPLNPEQSRGWYASARLSSVEPEQTTSVALLEGYTIIGQYRPRSPNASVSGKLLNFSVVSIEGKPEYSRSQYYAITEADGAFRLIGVPHHAILQYESTSLRWEIDKNGQTVFIQ